MMRSLRSKSVLFLAVYTLILEGSILAYFYFAGKDSIGRRSQQEVRGHAALAKTAVERALASSLAELTGLRSHLMLYRASAGTRDAGLKLLEEVVVSSPGKYAEIGLLDRATHRMLAVRAVREFRGIYPVVQGRTELDPSPGCPSESGVGNAAPPCVSGLLPGAREGLIRVMLPLGNGNPDVIVADLYLDFVVEAMRGLAPPPHVSVLACDRRGLILYADDSSLLRTYVQNSAPAWQFPLALQPGADAAARRSPAWAIRWEQLRRPEIAVAVQKDQGPEFQQLRARLYGLSIFTAAFTLLALLAVWVLASRMAASLRHVAEIANSVAAGDYSGRIAIRRNDELGLLIDSFNDMTVRLQASYRTLSDVNQQLQRKIHDLVRTRRQLSQKQRLALVGEALSKVSHEIQNKVGGVSVWVQNLERFGPKDDTTHRCVAELKTALGSFLDTLARFKRFYREPQLIRQRVEVKDLIDTCLARLGAEIEEKQLRVLRETGEDAASLDVDPAQMADAITNILLNAAYFSPPRGVLRIGLRQDDGHAVLSFRDEGPGLAPGAQLFHPFYTTKPSGSGLGLAVVRNIVNAHAGRVRAFNSSEGGACFEIRLPSSGKTEDTGS